MNKFLITISIIFCLISNHVDAKKLYKWVDEDGKVTFSDMIPPDQIKKEHQEVNKDGVVIENVDNIKTEEELKAGRQERIRRIKSEKEAAIQEKQRRNIILSYSNENEIIRLKEERLSAIERNIISAKQSQEFQKNSKEQLLSIAADRERDGQEVSKVLKSRVEIIENKINYQNQYIVNKQLEIKTILSKFDNDLKVYREAKSSEK